MSSFDIFILSWCLHVVSHLYSTLCKYAFTIIMLIPPIYFLIVMVINFYLQLSRDFIVHNCVLSARSAFMYTFVPHYCFIACLYLSEMTKIRMFNQSIHIGNRKCLLMPEENLIEVFTDGISNRPSKVILSSAKSKASRILSCSEK